MRLLVSLLLLGVTTSAGAVERVRNGNFDKGNSGFTTGMTYTAPARIVPGSANTYTVGTVPGVEATPYGHPNGMGNYLIGSGSASSRGLVWREAGIVVKPGTEYVFDNWFAALNATNRPVFEVYTNFNDGTGGHYLGTWRAERGVGIWQGMEARFVPTTSNLTISISDLTGANVGNNFALDAIRVVTQCEWAAGQPGGRPCSSGLTGSSATSRLAITASGAVPEPATWALMIAGFGFVGAAARNRRNGVRHTSA